MSESVVAGHIEQGKREDGSPAAYFLIRLYELDENGTPVVKSTWTGNDGKERNNYEYADTVRVPLSTLAKVISGDQKRCLVFKKM